MSEFEILTYNIHKGFSVGKLKFMLPNMREALRVINPDVIFLQEVQGEHRRHQRRTHIWPEQSQFEFLAQELWPHVAYGKNAIYQTGHHGNAILSKYPFIEWENINVSTLHRASRSVLHGVLVLNGKHSKIHMLCIHLGLFRAERYKQISQLIHRIAEHIPPDEPLIIAGDFNDWRKKSTDELEHDLGLKEVFKELEGDYAKSYPAWRPTFRNDRIYYRGVNLLSGRCLQHKNWRLLSDHLPLYAKFELF